MNNLSTLLEKYDSLIPSISDAEMFIDATFESDRHVFQWMDCTAIVPHLD